MQIIESARKSAAALQRLGIKPGDRIVVLLPNCPEVLISYQGILRAGAVIVPVVFRLEAREIAYILRNSGAVAVITTKDLLGKVRSAAENIETLKHLCVIEKEAVAGTLNLWNLIEANAEEPSGYAAREDDLAVILYTSGTTGLPKGVMLTHKNLYANTVSSYETARPDGSNQRSLVILPLAHSYGFTIMNGMYYQGSQFILMRWFNAEEAFRLIEKYRITDFAGVPTMFALMLESPEADKYDLSSLESCVSGSAPLPVELLQAFQKKFRCKIREGYGLSEAAPVVSTHYYNRVQKPGSVGQVLPGVKVRIVDADGQDVPSGETGELTVQGDIVTPGYYLMPEETAKTIRNSWLYTGDMAWMDAEGYLYLVERKKDLIIRGGFNIYPRDVEEVLLKHPAVLDATAVGMPDPIMGEEVKVFAVLRPAQRVGAKDLLEHCYQYLAKYKCPKQIEFVDEIPRNPMGKILRRKLQERIVQAAAGTRVHEQS